MLLLLLLWCWADGNCYMQSERWERSFIWFTQKYTARNLKPTLGSAKSLIEALGGEPEALHPSFPSTDNEYEASEFVQSAPNLYNYRSDL